MESRNIRYSVVRGLFAAVFTVFTVGLPVIVASCPMTPVPGRSGCCACSLPSGAAEPSVMKSSDPSCCATVIASGRSLAEYLTSPGFAHVETPHVGQPIPVLIPDSRPPLPAPLVEPAPGPPDDKPILHSSLLI